MKKYLMTGIAALTLGAAFTSCSHDDLFNPNSVQEAITDKYNRAFIEVFGQPAADQTWGFGGDETAGARVVTRSAAAPTVGDIVKPYDEAWVATYNQTATEPNSSNIGDNYDNSSYASNWTVLNAIKEGDADYEEKQWFTENKGGLSWDELVAWALEKHPTWVVYNADATFVRNFKITGTWNGGIDVVATEGLTDGVKSGNERTVVVTGTWNITSNQRVGSLGKIIIANGGTVNVAEGVTLNMVNEARLVVLPGGTLTGKGSVEVNNGNAVGEENYNGGTIDVAVFNNNFGKFYNYGKFLVTEYRGGAKESNFYNHSLVHIQHTGLGSETPNARIFNACQWYCEGDMRCKIYEGVNGSAFIVGGQLMVSGSEDGTTTPSYFGLAAGALVKVGSLYNNGTSWTGPTSGGYAALEIVKQIDFLNWVQDAPETGGYFENNIYVKAGKWNNIPGGNGMQAGDEATADYKFWNTVANCRGNNGVTKVNAGTNELLPADDDFVLGTAGCTPGFKGDKTPTVTPDPDPDPTETTETWGEWKRIICEDLPSSTTDFDFNDVVFSVRFNTTAGSANTKAQIRLEAAGGTLPLTVGWSGEAGTSYQNYEVHRLFGVSVSTMVNTNATNGVDGKSVVTYIVTAQELLGTTTFDATTKFNQIKIMVQRQGNWVEMTAHKGEPASKLCVGTDYVWCDERVDINTVYTNFKGYVQEGTMTEWWHAVAKDNE